MVRREIWAHWLTYNLIRKTMAQAALEHGKLPRTMSFANALAAVAAAWDHATVAGRDVLLALARAQFRVIDFASSGEPPRSRGTTGGQTPPQTPPAAERTSRAAPHALVGNAKNNSIRSIAERPHSERRPT